MDNKLIQEGEGIFVREAGVLPPYARKLLEEVGEEEVKSIKVVRTPLSSFTKSFLKVISLGNFEKVSKKYYDEMFHLALWINDKYKLEKNEVIDFSKNTPIKSNSQIREVKNIPQGLTINQLINKTRDRMGKENFSNYDAEKLNCQNFLINIFDANNIGDEEDRKFIFQDATKIFKELPEYSKILGKVSVKLGAIFNRLLYGEGEGQDINEYDEEDEIIYGSGLLNDLMKKANDKVVEMYADYDLRKNNPAEWQRQQDEKKRKQAIIDEERRKREEEYDKRKAEEKRIKQEELNRKINRPLEWYEVAGKSILGTLAGASVGGVMPLASGVVGSAVGREVECTMRGLTPEECRQYISKPDYKKELGKSIGKEILKTATGGISGLIGGGCGCNQYNAGLMDVRKPQLKF